MYCLYILFRYTYLYTNLYNISIYFIIDHCISVYIIIYHYISVYHYIIISLYDYIYHQIYHYISLYIVLEVFNCFVRLKFATPCFVLLDLTMVDDTRV